MDLAFASLAKIRILLLPVGSVTQSTLQYWQNEFRTFEEIRLSDIPADGRDERARFMPSPLASGSLHLSFTNHPQAPSREQLDLFRPSDFILGVVGIASCSQSDSLSTIYSQFTGSLADLFPLNSMFPLAQNCFIFEEGDGNTNLNVGNHLPGLVVIPSMMGNKKLYVGTLLAELCSNILGEFSLIVKSLESSLGSDGLSMGLFARLPEYKSPRHQLSTSYASDDATSISAPDLSGPSSVDQGKLSMKRASTMNPSAFGQQNKSSLITPSQPKPRQSIAASGSAHARLYKILGDLFLLAGRTMDASIWYSEAVHQLTRPQDTVWLAASLEGTVITAIVDTWLSNRSSDLPESKEIWLEHSEKLTRAASLYSQAVDTPGADQYLPELSSLYTEACLRHASLLFSVWRAGGWNDLCSTLLRGNFDTSGTEAKSITAQSRFYMPINGVSRSDVSAILVQAHGPWLLHLSHRERIEVLSRISSLYSEMRYKRREAYIMREIVACLMDLVVQGRDEAKNMAKFRGAEKNIGSSEGHVQEDLGIREGDFVTGNDSLLRLVKYICNIHSVDLDTVAFDESRTAPDNAKAAPYGWTDLQVGLVREAIAVAEALPDYAAVILLALSALRGLHRSLDADDQYHFFTTAARALTTIRRRGDERKLIFWPEEIVNGLSLVPLPWAKTPVERPLGDLKQQSEVDREKAGRVDPFLYNPRQSVLSKDTIAIANEEISFLVQLENPYSFVLEILSITLSTSGVPFECNSVHLELQPNSSELVTLTGKASSPGTLTIRGCFLQLPGTKLHESLVPIFTEEEEQNRILRAAAEINEADRTKYASLSERLEKRDSMGASSGRNSKSVLPPKYLTLKVIPEQPSMSIRRTSLTNGAVMLYEGETTTIYLVIENTASLPVDFLELSFDDSLKSYYSQLLGSDEISAFEKYEAEYTLVHKPVFSSVAMEDSSVNQGEERVLAMRCYGKANCTEGIIQVSYAYAQRKGNNLQEPLKSFYTRRLVFPVIVSVFEVLECSSMNILPLSALTTNSSLNEWQSLFKNRSGFDWCALTLDVQNIYGLAFEVTLSYDQQISTTKVIPPGATYRFLVPVKRVRLQESETEAPIPSLTQRQFVVSGLASNEDKIQRELFWYREDLLNKLNANWKETGGMRNGELSLRRQRFTQPMLEAYKVEDVQVRLSLVDLSGDHADTLPSGTSPVAPNEVVQVSVEIVNTTSSIKTLAVSLDIDPAWNVIASGLIKSIPIGDLESQGKMKQTANFVFMAQGRYTIQARVTDALARHDIALGKGSFEVICGVLTRP